ncbi:cupin [Candidatus Bathyarchaeota archaeon]|jgi:quercetin dioxygenase-like cupin family protein|nr:cupin [Candidatus Bathyarchaeota archaeon]MDP6048804.1 cupin domain-containing protein [Candidatus Bathyarchaeota archaeon]MDP6458086.1 cupin domain-containing protein [Candidatus Bathyarchaeota archaeon]|tara:strand:+ start:1586 stop:1927 length:342 start_codon:yes stop_codon:yes gene_type:complete
MKTFLNEEVKEDEVPAPADGVKIRWLLTEETGAPTFSMRQFTVTPGGSTPQHTHPWEHEAYILEGSGTILGGEEVEAVEAGTVVYIPPDELHQFKNTGDRELKFLCMIPNQKK